MAEIVPVTKNILIVAGDVSGDLHGANLIKELKKADPEVTVSALGGAKMKEACDKFIYDLTSTTTNGFIEPFFKTFLWIRIINVIRKFMEEKRPACIITVDFYGLNHQLLGLAQHRKIPAFYYISPQVWATRAHRAEKLARLVRHMLVIFPFEKEIYRQEGAQCTFVGHPLLDIMPTPVENYKPPKNGNWKIGIMPGSRKNEVKKHMPVFWAAFEKIQKKFPNSEPFIFATENISNDFILKFCIAGEDKKLHIVREKSYTIRQNLDFVITASGTATLENAMLNIPMTVAYKTSAVTYEIAKRLIKVDHISLVNIIAKKEIVKEFVQKAVTAENIAGEVMKNFQDPQKLLSMREELSSIKEKMGTPGAAKRSAAIIIKSLFGNS